MCSRIIAVLLCSVSLVSGRASGQQLPPPTPLPIEPSAPPLVIIPQSRSAYEHWQYLAVDRRGQLRPRIVSTPEGAFRAVDGAPFPWRSNYPVELKPTAGNPAR
jgi:hypothetical protein